MQVLCKTSNEGVEARCSVCGQGFVLYWERQTREEHAEALVEVEKALRNHHRTHSGLAVHPEHGFLVPEWDGPVVFSGDAILGHAPGWAL